LQLPAIARVSNLENGLSILLRLNDRGPAAPGRMLELTPRAAAVLGAHDGTQLRLVVQEAESRQLATALQGNGPDLAVATAPTGDIKAESLAPPTGVAAGRVRAAPDAPKPVAAASALATPPVPARLPEQALQGPVESGRLFIDAGAFSQAQYARLLAGRLAGLGAEVTTDYAAPRDRAYQVRLGPFGSVAEADAALDRARGAGVTDGRIIVQP
jgi:rare lipoprotein A